MTVNNQRRGIEMFVFAKKWAVGAFLLAAFAFGMSSACEGEARAADLVPYFRSDRIGDGRILAEALAARDPFLCAGSSNVEACADAVRLVVGDVTLAPRWAGFADPCTMVMSVGRRSVDLYSPSMGEWRRRVSLPKGWKRGQFLGACTLQTFEVRL